MDQEIDRSSVPAVLGIERAERGEHGVGARMGDEERGRQGRGIVRAYDAPEVSHSRLKGRRKPHLAMSLIELEWRIGHDPAGGRTDARCDEHGHDCHHDENECDPHGLQDTACGDRP